VLLRARRERREWLPTTMLLAESFTAVSRAIDLEVEAELASARGTRESSFSIRETIGKPLGREQGEYHWFDPLGPKLAPKDPRTTCRHRGRRELVRLRRA
jgi:hypothetical protein